MLPFDIHCEVMSVVDFHTLKVCSLLSRAHHEAAARRLWKTFTIATAYQGIPERARSHIETRANFISHGFGATRVRRLRIFINAALGSSELDPSIHTSIRAIGLAMRATKNIVRLDVQCGYHSTRLAQEMSTLPPSWAPDLRRFTTDLSCGDALSTFWRWHSGITELELLFDADCTRPLDFSPLPHLTTMRVATPSQTSCVSELHAPRGSPLESISIRAFRDSDALSLSANLAHVFTRLTHLDLAIDPNTGASSVMYERIISRFINLRRLKVTHSQLSAENANRAEVAVRTLNHLEEFEWNGVGVVSIRK